MIALVLALMLLADVPPAVDCINPSEETLILFFPGQPLCPDQAMEVK